MKFEEIAVTKM